MSSTSAACDLCHWVLHGTLTHLKNVVSCLSVSRLRICLSLSVCLSACLPPCLIYLSPFLSVSVCHSLPVCLSILFSVYLWLPDSLSVCLSVSLSLALSACLKGLETLCTPSLSACFKGIGDHVSLSLSRSPVFNNYIMLRTKRIHPANHEEVSFELLSVRVAVRHCPSVKSQPRAELKRPRKTATKGRMRKCVFYQPPAPHAKSSWSWSNQKKRKKFRVNRDTHNSTWFVLPSCQPMTLVCWWSLWTEQRSENARGLVSQEGWLGSSATLCWVHLKSAGLFRCSFHPRHYPPPHPPPQPPLLSIFLFSVSLSIENSSVVKAWLAGNVSNVHYQY